MQIKQSIIATTTLDNKAINDTNTNTPDMTFAISTKKIDIATEKIYAFNAKKQDNIIPSTKKDNPCQEHPQIIFLDSHGTTDTSESNQCQPEQNTSDCTRNKTESTQEADTKQLQVEKISSPASSLIYKTPPSSPNPDAISDLNEEDLAALNEIP